MRRTGLVGLVCLLLFTGLTIVGSPAQGFTVHCTAKTKKELRACDTSGYAEVYTKSHWRMYGGHNCTNYAAYRMQIAGVPEPTILMGNARDWAANAKKLGYTVNQKPTVGAIAHWKKAASHVAYVEEVGPDYLVLSEDSYTSKTYRRYTVRTGASWYPERFIHFIPMGSAPPATTAPAPKPVKARATVTVTGPKKVSTRIKPTITVRVATSDGSPPAGRVRVRRGGVTVATTTVTAASKGVASVKIPRMKRGKQWISAVYDGGPTVKAATSPVIKVVVKKPPKVIAAKTTITLPSTPIQARTRAVANVRVKPKDGRAVTNKVSVYVDGKLVKAPKLTAKKKGKVSVRLPKLTPGTHRIKATYWGSKTVKRSTSGVTKFTVVEPTTSSVALASPTVSASAGTSVTAAVAARGGAPTVGEVRILVDGAPVASARLTAAAAGRVTIPLSGLEPGSHQVAAQYVGGGYWTASTSPARTLTVTAPTTTTATLKATPIASTKRAKLTVSVSAAGTATKPAGTVVIRDGSTQIATGKVVAGTVTVTLPKLEAGTYKLRAAFAGGGLFEPSASAVAKLKVTK